MPEFRKLDPFECNALLATQRLGRLAYSITDGVDIEPINFVWADGWIYGRMGEGTKSRAVSVRPRVALLVDAIVSMFDWHSVVVKGTLHVFTPSESDAMQHEFEHALAHIRRVIPVALTDDDPTPSRSIVFGIRAEQITGRAASRD